MIDIINWENVKYKIENVNWASKLYKTTKEKLDHLILNYYDDSSRIAAWGHHYNCSDCQSSLLFDIDKQNDHVCSNCGKVNKNELLNKVWYNIYRGYVNTSIYNAAIIYKYTKDEKYITHIKKVLNFYADNYDDFICEPPAKRFEGKIQSQHLDDAVGTMTILLGLDIIKEVFTKDELNKYYDNLFKKQAEMYDFFANRIYNIPVWIKCAQSMIGVFFNEEEHIKRGLYDIYGLVDQLERGVTKEGMWYEGSTGYHFYTLTPICYLLYLCKRQQVDIPKIDYIYDTVEKMFEYPIKMMFADKTLPNPNDTSPSLNINRYKTQYEYASVIFDNDLFNEVCSSFYHEENTVSSVTRLLFNHFTTKREIRRYKSINNPNSHTAMLRKGNSEVFIKHGVLTDLHRHPDTMNIELAFAGDVVSCDIGNGGYASSLFVEWQRRTIAHNTVVIDKKDHFEMYLPLGVVEEFRPEDAYIRTKAKGIYEAVDFTRELQAFDNHVVDNFFVNCWGEYVIDWAFYCKGDITFDYDYEKIDKIGENDGYKHLMDIKKFSGDNDWFVSFELDDKTITLSMDGLKDTEVFVVNSYTKSLRDTRYGVIVRRYGSSTTYKAIYSYVLKK